MKKKISFFQMWDIFYWSLKICFSKTIVRSTIYASITTSLTYQLCSLSTAGMVLNLISGIAAGIGTCVASTFTTVLLTNMFTVKSYQGNLNIKKLDDEEEWEAIE